jgi:hypothetical protein
MSRMTKKKKHRIVATTTSIITTTKVKPSVCLCILDTDVANVQEESDLFFHSLFTLQNNKRRPGGPEGVSRCIVDARKANLYSHTHTYKSSLMSLLPSSVFFLSSASISDHRKTTRSENDRFHSVFSVLFCIKLDGVELFMCVSR